MIANKNNKFITCPFRNCTIGRHPIGTKYCPITGKIIKRRINNIFFILGIPLLIIIASYSVWYSGWEKEKIADKKTDDKPIVTGPIIIKPAPQDPDKTVGSDDSKEYTNLKRAKELISKGKYLDGGKEAPCKVFDSLLTSKHENIVSESREGLQHILLKANELLKKNDLQQAENILAALSKCRDKDIREKAQMSLSELVVKYKASMVNAINNNDCLKATEFYKRANGLSPNSAELNNYFNKIKASVGYISIFSDPWSYVYINGVDTKLIAPVQKIEVMCGKYDIRLYNPDFKEYKDRRITISVYTGKEVKIIASGNNVRQQHE